MIWVFLDYSFRLDDMQIFVMIMYCQFCVKGIVYFEGLFIFVIFYVFFRMFIWSWKILMKEYNIWIIL